MGEFSSSLNVRIDGLGDPEFDLDFGSLGPIDDVLFYTNPHSPFGGDVGSTAVAASALRQVAKEDGYPLSDAVLKILLGHAAFESGYGRGDPAKNTLANTNNWGSVQATKQYFVQPNLGKPGFGAVAYQDSDPKKGPFIGWYAVYPNAIEGARGFFHKVKPAITTDIDQYAANLYHRGYYVGFHKDDSAANIADYAKAVRRAMPGSVPADSPASIAEAQRFSVGPFAPVFNRMTAKNHVDGAVKWPATIDDAKSAWEKSWSNPAAYGLSLVSSLIDFANVVENGGVVWLGPQPPGFTGGSAGSSSQFGVESSYAGFAQGAVGSTAVAASALRQVAKEDGYPLSDAVLKILLGHAAFESGYGRGDPAKNTLANTNNWGSVQATKQYFVQPNLGKPGFGAVAHQDSDPKKGPFIGWYAVYPNAIEGARGFFHTVKPAITTDIDQYAANLYHRGYYGGVHKDDSAANIADYAKAVRRAMPGSVPADSPASIAEAQRFSVGPFAPVFNRMTAKNHVDGAVKWPATIDDAKSAWEKSWSNPAAYGLSLVSSLIDFANVVENGGVVWLGPQPPGFTGGSAGSSSRISKWMLPIGGVVGAIVGAPIWGLGGAIIGAATGASVGYIATRASGLVSALAGTLKPAPSIATSSIETAAATVGPIDPKSVQTKLNALGLGPLTVDGKIGPKTQSALVAFQKAHGLSANGVLGVSTLRALGL